MTNTGYELFDTTLQKTNIILKEIEGLYGWYDRRNQSYAILRSVLHALRDRLSVEQAVHLGSELPLLLRGTYYESWEPLKNPVKLNKEEFIDRIASEFQFNIIGTIQDLISNVLAVLFSHLSPGRAEKVRAELPLELKNIVTPV